MRKWRLVGIIALAAFVGSCSREIYIGFSPTAPKQGTFTFAAPQYLLGGEKEITLHCITVMSLLDTVSNEVVWSQYRGLGVPCVDRHRLPLGERLPGYTNEYDGDQIVSGRRYSFAVSGQEGGGDLEFRMP